MKKAKKKSKIIKAKKNLEKNMNIFYALRHLHKTGNRIIVM